MSETSSAVSPSAFEILAGKPAAFDATASLLAAQGHIVRFIRGAKVTSKAALFDEFAAALQFPYHFGQNWDAVADCLTDLDWLGVAFGFYVVIWDADQFLAGDPGNLAVFAQLAAEANESWANSSRKEFKVVLQTTGDKAEHVRAVWGQHVGAIPNTSHDTAWD